MRKTENQRKIIDFALSNNGYITKKQACELIPYYHNTAKHVGDVLSRMVKSNMLTRVKNGLYQLSNGQKDLPNQLSLLKGETK